ncbi:MAG: hypothetical protein OQK07_05595, partial [Rhodospirillales bacterium]|nr:hypothetical protein [Rhodospirillales bacterium]
SDQVNAVRAVFSGRHLQVFTSGAEWMVTGDPLTPGNVQIRRQTRIGSAPDRTVPPRDVDGATLFAGRGGNDLREFLFADVEQAYQSADLALLSRHLVNDPVDQDFDPSARRFLMVMGDGTLGVVTLHRAEQVTAWARWTTDGAFRSLAVADGVAHVLVERGGALCLEVFDVTLALDGALDGAADPPTDTWSGLGHLEGRTVSVLADGAVVADAVVAGGAAVLDRPASSAVIGLPFSHVVEPLQAASENGATARRVRLIAATFRLRDTAALVLDTGRGPVAMPFKRMGDGVLDAPPLPFTGDRTVRALGWRDAHQPLWRIEQDAPLPFTLLSVTAEIKAG